MTKRKISLRVLNDFRKSDPLAYLSLRYTVGTKVSIKDTWAREIAPEILKRRENLGFLENRYFKQINQKGTCDFRSVYYPSGTQALVEAALLDECSRAGRSFKMSDSVYSYQFAKRYSTDGVYVPYFELYSKRQTDMGRVCEKYADHLVLYADIKNFYPSITSGRIQSCWRKTCDSSSLSEYWKDIGSYLIDQQFKQKRGLLIGPQFSHLLANLILKDVDNELSSKFPGRYFRYVDDFAFIIPRSKSQETVRLLKSMLLKLGLKLNQQKTGTMDTKQWRTNAPFQIPESHNNPIGDEGWMHFIDHLKVYLMSYPKKHRSMKNALKRADIRVPLPRYQTAIRENIYTAGLSKRINLQLLDNEIHSITPSSLVKEGRKLRKQYTEELKRLWSKFIDSEDMLQKWNLSRIRYLLGRIMLIGTENQIFAAHKLIKEEPRLGEYSAMLKSIITKDITDVLGFGWKVASAVAQPLSAIDVAVTCTPKRWSKQAIEAYTAFLLAGVEVNATLSQTAKRSNRIKATIGDYKLSHWSKTKDVFYREFFALSAAKTIASHVAFTQVPIDPNEHWELFADDLLGIDPS